MFTFAKLTLARQYMLYSLLFMLVAMLMTGTWVSRQITQGILNRTAAITALYVDSYVSPRLQALMYGELGPADVEEMNRLVEETGLGQQIVSFKVWSPLGVVLFSPVSDLIGQQFPVEGNLAEALSGNVVSEITRLQRPEHAYEQRMWDQLIETYAPVRASGSDEIIAVSEFYQKSDDFMAEIRSARLRSWLVIGVGGLAIYVLLAGIVGRASNTIVAQQHDLEQQLTRERELLTQIQQLHDRMRRAAARSTSLNEQYLRRISADLHDGPGQDLALALMRIDTLCTSMSAGDPSSSESLTRYEDICIVQNTLDSALRELRVISAGLRLPEFEPLTPFEVIKRAIRDYERKTGETVRLSVERMSYSASVPAKITAYRVLQESLANSFQHANGADQTVRVQADDSSLQLEVIDDGPGFDPDSVSEHDHLGLIGMRERVELLGGVFDIETAIGQGTCVRAIIPLHQSPSPSAQ